MVWNWQFQSPKYLSFIRISVPYIFSVWSWNNWDLFFCKEYSLFLQLLIYLFVSLTRGCTGAPEKDTRHCVLVILKINLIKTKIESHWNGFLTIFYFWWIHFYYRVFILVFCQISKNIFISDISDFFLLPYLLNVSFPLSFELEKNNVFPCTLSEL